MSNGDSLVFRQRAAMNLHAARGFRGIGWLDLVVTNEAPGGIIKLVVVDFPRGKVGVEGELDIRDKRCVVHDAADADDDAGDPDVMNR